MSKRRKYIIGMALAAGCLVAPVTGAEAQSLAALPASTSPALAVGDTRPVRAWFGYCDRNPADCAVDTAESTEITLNHAAWQKLVAVNLRVNAQIKPLTDEEHWGLVDAWDLPADGYGDCEDYQLYKRKLLVEAGFPRRALLMTVVLDEKGEGHAVLMARTDRGDFILDNKVQAVLPWHQTGYVFVKREGQHGPDWASLGGAMSPFATANR